MILSNKITAIDLFSGIGGIRQGFHKAFGSKLKFVFSSEIDPKAKETYAFNFGESPSGDITKIKETDIPHHDILLAGFPCQSFSVAGSRGGFNTDSGQLFFEVIRIAIHSMPEVIFLENVKGLVKHDNGDTLKTILSSLEEIGYKVYHKVLNAKHYGLPQNRERVFFVAFKDHDTVFNWPINSLPVLQVKDLLEEEVPPKYYYNEKPIYDKFLKDEVTNPNSVYQIRRSYVRENKSGVCPTLTANMGTGGNNVPIIVDEKGVRKLTPKECLRLQGFSPNFKFPKNMADSHRYKQIGNSVTVKVVSDIAEEINKSLDNRRKELRKMGGLHIEKKDIHVDELGFFSDALGLFKLFNNKEEQDEN